MHPAICNRRQLADGQYENLHPNIDPQEPLFHASTVEPVEIQAVGGVINRQRFS
jgi:hypothetical protein